MGWRCPWTCWHTNCSAIIVAEIALFVMLAAVTAAKAEEAPTDFDGRSGGGLSAGTTEREVSFDGSAVQMPHFAVSDATVTCGGVEYSVNAMPIMCGGWVLPPELAEEILQHVHDRVQGADKAEGIVKSAENRPQQAAARDIGMRLAGVFTGLPVNVREDFFKNLRFLNGNLVSAKTDLLEKAVAPAKFEEIINVIMPAAPGAKDIKSVTRRKDEACNASTGAKGREVLRGCDYQPGYTCNPATCK